MVETKGPQMTSQYGAYALHDGTARIHALMHMHKNKHAHPCTHRPVSNTHFFFHHNNVTLHVFENHASRRRVQTTCYPFVVDYQASYSRNKKLAVRPLSHKIACFCCLQYVSLSSSDISSVDWRLYPDSSHCFAIYLLLLGDLPLV